MRRDSVTYVLLVALALCVVCSVLVSATAVVLRPRQEANRVLERQINVLKVVGLYQPGASVDELLEHVKPVVVNVDTGEVATDINPNEFNQEKAANDPAQSVALDPEADIAGIRRRAKDALIYVVRKPDGSLDQIVFPVHGKGLWSTMYGYISLDAKDLNTVRGLTFYEQKETPGLGGEVSNPKWLSQWADKKVFDDAGDVRVQVIHGNVTTGDPNAQFEVDGLSGATFTSRGVTNLLRYWLGPEAFGKFIDNLKEHPNMLAQHDAKE